jgi:hypothetical protein
MKRSERDKVKTDTAQRHFDSRNDSRDQNERHVTGDVHVGGKVEIDFAPTVVDKHDTERKQDNTNEDRRFFWNILIQGSTLFAVAIYAGLTAWQACSTKVAADAARDNIIQVERNTHLDERAWLGIEAIPGTAKIGEFFGAIVNFKNSGKTPAINMRHAGLMDKGESEPDAFAQCADALNKPNRGIVEPGGINSIPVSTRDNWPKLIKNWQESPDFKGKKIYIYGCIVYDDIFLEKQHWLTFCSSWKDSINAFENCSHGNDTGDTAKH